MMGYILSIEDNLQNAALITHILTSEGYTVRHATNGLDGIRCAVDERPDLILLDFNLPDIDGRNMILTLRKRLGNIIPIIPCTARTDEMEKRLSQLFGANAFLGKPFEPDELVKLTEHFLKTD